MQTSLTLTLQAPLRPLMPRQHEGFRYLGRMLQAGRGGLLFKEMRLGKTATFIRFAKSYKLPGPFLILCPSPVKLAWVNELIEEKEKNFVVLKGTNEDKRFLLDKNFKWFICNFESAIPTLFNSRKKKKAEHERKGIDVHLYNWNAIVVDESVKIASSKSDTAKYLLRFFPHIKLKYCLCGLPAPEHERQYVQQFIFVLGEFMGCKSLWDFENRYYTKIGYDLIPKLGVKKEIYNFLHKWAYVCTRKEAGIGSKIISSIRYIEMTPTQKKAYKSMQDDMSYGKIETKYAVSQWGYLRKIASGYNIDKEEWFNDNKLKEIRYLLSTELKGQQIIIGCKELHELDYLYQGLSTKYNCRFINGDVDPEIKEQYRRDFQAGKYQIQIATIKSLAKGNDWSKASCTILFSLEPSNDLMSQFRDRGIHMLKKEPFLMLYLLTKGTVDEDIYEFLGNKNENSSFFMSRLLQRIQERK